MVAKITLKDGRAATLTDALVWESADEEFAHKLNADFPGHSGLSVLPPGYGCAIAAGHFFGVEPEFTRPLDPLPPGAVS